MNTQKIKTFVNTAKSTIVKHSPEILLVTGIVSGAAGLVVCIKKTLTINEKLEDNYIDILEVDRKDTKEVIKVYSKAGLTVAREYAPVVLLEGVSMACIVGSNKILNERNLSLLAAVTFIDKDFKRYRENVKKRFGDEVDNELYYGIETEKVTETVIDPETGKKKKVKEEVKNPNSRSPYAVFIDDTNDLLGGIDGKWLLSNLRNIENGINEKAKEAGKIFLSDIYKDLCIRDDQLTVEQRRASRNCGYVWDSSDCNEHQIKFFVCDTWNKEAVRAAELGEARPDRIPLLIDFSNITFIADAYADGAGTFWG